MVRSRRILSELDLTTSPCSLPTRLDKEQLGDKGLFEDIAEGLLSSRAVVAFISDEYAKSQNCLMEFQSVGTKSARHFFGLTNRPFLLRL